VNKLWKRIWSQDRGSLTFEWILLITVVVIGIVGGLSAVRDAIISELGDLVGAAVHLDQSYTVTQDGCSKLGTQFGFQDSLPKCFSGSRPATPVIDQGPVQNPCGT